MNIFKPLLTVFILGVIVFVFYYIIIFPNFVAKAKVVHLVDPDSLIVLEGDELKNVQLIGIDAPEFTGDSRIHQCYDREARMLFLQLFSALELLQF